MHTITVVKHNLWSIYFEKNYCYERYERNNVTHWKKSNHRIFSFVNGPVHPPPPPLLFSPPRCENISISAGKPANCEDGVCLTNLTGKTKIPM